MAAGVPAKVRDQGVVVADPDEDGGGVGGDSLLRLRTGDAVAEAGIAEDELVEGLLAGGGGEQGQSVEDVVEQGAGDGDVRGLGCEVVTADGGAGEHADGGEQGGRGEMDEGELVGRAGRGDERQGDGELGLGGDERGPAIDLRGIDEGTGLVAGGE